MITKQDKDKLIAAVEPFAWHHYETLDISPSDGKLLKIEVICAGCEGVGGDEEQCMDHLCEVIDFPVIADNREQELAELERRAEMLAHAPGNLRWVLHEYEMLWEEAEELRKMLEVFLEGGPLARREFAAYEPLYCAVERLKKRAADWEKLRNA